MTESAEHQWYFAQAGEQQGPVAEAEMRQMLAAGKIDPTDMVWRQGMPQWIAAGSVPGLLPAPAAPPPPVAPPPHPTGWPGPPQPVMPIGYAGPRPGHGPYGAAPANIGHDPGMRWLLPVGRSGWAIAAGYLGLFSFIIFPAPIALIISIIAIMDIKKHPERHGMGRAIFGLIMGILGTVVLCFFFVGLAISK